MYVTLYIPTIASAAGIIWKVASFPYFLWHLVPHSFESSSWSLTNRSSRLPFVFNGLSPKFQVHIDLLHYYNNSKNSNLKRKISKTCLPTLSLILTFSVASLHSSLNVILIPKSWAFLFHVQKKINTSHNMI